MPYPEWPAHIAPKQIRWQLAHNSNSFTSPFTQVKQSINRPGTKWIAELEFSLLNIQDEDTLAAFTDDMQGQAHAVKLFDHARPGVRPLGSPVVAAANQTGRSLQTRGWAPSATVLKKGQLFNIGHELKRARQDILSDASGNALLKFNPPLRKSPALNTGIGTERPYMLATLQQNGVTFSRVPGIYSACSIKFMEAIYK